MAGADAVWFNMRKGRGIGEARKTPEEFVGRAASDSRPAWNRAGTERQKRRLRHGRDLKKTIQENRSPEFQASPKNRRGCCGTRTAGKRAAAPTEAFKPGSGSGAA